MRRSVVFVLGLALASLLAAPLLAQEGEYTQATWVTVKPGMVPEFEDFVKKLNAGAAKINAPRGIAAYSLAMGGAQRTYVFAGTFRKWAELDGDLPISQTLAKAYGEVEGGKIYKAGSSAIESSETRISRVIPEVSRAASSGGGQAAYVFVIRTEVEPSAARTYRKYLDKLKAAEDKHDPNPVSRRVSVLGDAQVFTTIRGFNKWAERDAVLAAGQAMIKAYGEEEARELADAAAGCIRNRTTYVLAHRPDLSRTGTAPTTND